MTRACFVILHFNATRDTIECVDSILNLENSNYNIEIVIIDNGSNNNGVETLKQKYLNYDKIFILRSEINLGFAKGNNIGYRYAKEELGADFIIILNNDVIINQIDFLKKMGKSYNDFNFFVLGPDILSIDGESHQNPLRRNELNTNQIKKMIFDSKRSYIYTFIKNIPIVQNLKGIIKHNKGATSTENYKSNLDTITENVVIHGAGIVFSKLYIDKFDTAFFPKTFLYAEEDILYLRCKKYNLKIIYDSSIQIIHKEDVSTSSMFNANIKKERFILKNRIKSLKILNDLIEDNSEL